MFLFTSLVIYSYQMLRRKRESPTEGKIEIVGVPTGVFTEYCTIVLETRQGPLKTLDPEWHMAGHDLDWLVLAILYQQGARRPFQKDGMVGRGVSRGKIDENNTGVGLLMLCLPDKISLFSWLLESFYSFHPCFFFKTATGAKA